MPLNPGSGCLFALASSAPRGHKNPKISKSKISPYHEQSHHVVNLRHNVAKPVFSGPEAILTSRHAVEMTAAWGDVRALRTGKQQGSGTVYSMPSRVREIAHEGGEEPLIGLPSGS